MPDTTDFQKGFQERKRDAKASEKSDARGKNNGVWEDIDHIKFVQGVRTYGKDWKKIVAFIGTKTPL